MSTAAIAAGTIGAIGSIGSAAIGSNAASTAAGVQANAELNAQQLQAKEAQDALDFNKQQYQTTLTNEQPYLDAGGKGLNALEYGLGVGGTPNGSGVGSGSLTTPYQSFSAPTGLTEANDPGYQARLALGTEALQKSAAARGSVLTGGTAKALDTYGQDYASNEYGNVYNRALNTYGTNAGNYYTGQQNAFTRLSGLTGVGQTATGQVANAGQAAANTNANIDLTSGQQQGQDITNAGTATASGIVGSANAWGGALSGTAGNLGNLVLLNQLSNSGYGQSGMTKPGAYPGGGLYGSYGM
jgi:hypothetical protein